jgi:hypothetical protein
MRLKHIQIITFIAVLLTGACAESDAQQTLVAENAFLSTQIVDLRTTATFEADQLKQTEEYIETIVPKAARLRDEIASTLQASGIDVTKSPVEPNTAFALPTSPASASNQTQPLANNPNSTLAQSDGTLPTATPGQPTLFNLVTAAEVGSNDCALAAVTTFTPDTTKIYVVATASNIAAGTTLSAQWYLDTTLLTKQEFAPDQDINNNCIWFYAEPVDFPFATGNYRVELFINGASISGAQAIFTIKT